MPATTTNVTVSTYTVGEAFGTRGLVKSARTGKVLKTQLRVRPYGFASAALSDAIAECERRGWTIVSDSE